MAALYLFVLSALIIDFVLLGYQFQVFFIETVFNGGLLLLVESPQKDYRLFNWYCFNYNFSFA